MGIARMFLIALKRCSATIPHKRGTFSLLAAVALAGVLSLHAVPARANPIRESPGEYGGYTGPGPAIVTVERAKALNDDSPVALKGRIVREIGKESYLFQDDTGSVEVEIDDKVWQGRHIGPENVVVLHGEVEKDWNRLQIDVKRIILP